MSLEQDFLDLLDHEDSVAVVILAHFAALVRPFEHGLWFFDGWSAAVVDTVGGVLGEDDMDRIAWPKRYIEHGMEC